MTTTAELREALGRLGIWMPPMPALGLDPAQYGKAIEDAGFRSVWFPGVNNPENLEPLAQVLAGTSRPPRVESTGRAYEKPYSRTVEFLDALPPTQAPVVLAALGPRMLQLAQQRTLGAHPYFVPPEHTAFARLRLG